MIGDKAKFIGIIIGLTFASFIITQQAGIFVGLMSRTYGFLTDTRQPDIWLMDPEVQFVDDVKPFKMTKLYQARGITGVEWAVPLYKGLLKARLPSGTFQICNVIGIDDATLIGGPPFITQGKIENLRIPDAVIINEVGARKKLASTINGKKVPMQYGEVFEINDRRARVYGFCETVRTFQSQPVIYTTFEKALRIAPSERDLLSFVLIKSQEGVDSEKLAQNISDITGLLALTTKQFRDRSLRYYMTQTGIPINFGVAVILGVIIGVAIAGQTFYTFAHDNMRYFATFKAMGATNKLISKMILVQALMVATIGWSFGIGLTTLFGGSSGGSELSFSLPWWLFLGSGVAIYCITLLAAAISLYKIIRLEPSIVFQS